MLKLEDIKKNASVVGVEPGQIVRIVTTEPVGDNALTVYYKTAEGRLLERMLWRIQVVTGGGRVRGLLITEFVLN